MFLFTSLLVDDVVSLFVPSIFGYFVGVLFVVTTTYSYLSGGFYGFFHLSLCILLVIPTLNLLQPPPNKLVLNSYRRFTES